MRFVIDQHKRIEHLPHNPSLPRHCESLEVGRELLEAYTKRALRGNKPLKEAFELANGIPSEPQQRQPRAAKSKKVKFPTTRFTCIEANPVAQVWLCTKERYEAMTVGRNSKTSKLPEGDKLPHLKGELAVLKGDVPVLDDNGQVKVFANRLLAEEVMERIYRETPADEKLLDNNDPDRPTTTVYRNRNYSVHFDPDFNGALFPFNVYDTRVHKVVLHPKGDTPLKFKSIIGAIEEADRRDRDIRGV